MAFSLGKVNKIGGQSLRGNAPQYITYDNGGGDTVTGAGFFNNLANLLSSGDIITVVNYTSGVPSGIVDYLVTGISNGEVTIVAAR